MGETSSSREAGSVDGEKTQRKVRATCCGCMSLRRAILLLTIGGLILSITFTILYGMRLGENMADMPAAEVLVTGFAMGMWLWLIVIMILGLYAVWKEHSSFVEAYFWIFIAHWICDLGVGIGYLSVMWQIKGPLTRNQCAKIGQDCSAPMYIVFLALTAVWTLNKLFGFYVCYLLFCYRSVVLVNNDVERPKLTGWLSKRDSASSAASLFGKKRLFSPSKIPSIKIDYASDQSTASTYSNDSPSREFGYPKVQTPPAALYASHPGGSTLNYSNYAQEGYTHDGKVNTLPYQQPSHQPEQTLPGFSSAVIGANKGN